MTGVKFSIKHILVLIAFVAVACTLLLKANWIVFFCVFNLLVLTYLSTLVAGVILSGRSRVFCIGFSIFGIGYFLLANSQSCGDFLGTNIALTYAYQFVPRQTPPQSIGPMISVQPTAAGVAPQAVNPPPSYYYAPTQPVPTGAITAPNTVYSVATPVPPLYVSQGTPIMAPTPLSWGKLDFKPFVKVGSCLFSVLIGLCGGVFAVFISKEKHVRSSLAAT